MQRKDVAAFLSIIEITGFLQPYREGGAAGEDSRREGGEKGAARAEE